MLQKWLLVHRAHLHTALRKKATEKAGEGSPATLVLGNKVVAVDPENAQVTLESGEKVAGDVLIGADGVHVREATGAGKEQYLTGFYSRNAEQPLLEVTSSSRLTAATVPFAS